VYPGLHVQLFKFVAASGDKLSKGHKVHAAVPAMSLYVPRTQAMHRPGPDEVYPMLHMQLVRFEEPCGETEFVEHAMQSETLVMSGNSL
jgi:hypothetical protein